MLDKPVFYRVYCRALAEGRVATFSEAGDLFKTGLRLHQSSGEKL
jgi:hypothetical protein